MKKEIKDFYLKYRPYIKGLFAIMLFFCSSIFSLIPIKIFNLDMNNLTEKESLILSIFDYIILIIIYILMYKNDLIKDFKKFKKHANKNIDIGFKYWIIGLFFMVFSNMILIKVFHTTSSNNEEAVQSYIKTFPTLALITTSILGPFVEEIVFRKTFKDMFKKPIVFIILSGLCFGVLHVIGQSNNLIDYLYFLPYTALGISFAYMYYKSDTFYTSWMMHFIHNLVLTLISIITL